MSRHAKHRSKVFAKTRHHRSVSLEHDHAQSSRARPYLVTGCANRAIRRVLDGLVTVSGTRAWTLTGPFGTGKSSFGLFLSQLLEHSTSPASRDAQQTLMRADKELHAMLQSALPRSKGIVPVIVTGAREPLSNALARAFTLALSASAGPGASRLAKEFREIDGRATHFTLKSAEKAITCLTAGASTGGVLIVIDELGKLLEYAAAHPRQSDVYLLQQLAEYAARSPVPTLLIGILHQDFAGYAQELPETDRREWDKIRGRFEDIIFEQSADDMLRLIAEAMSAADGPDAAREKVPSAFQSMCRDAWKHSLVPAGLEQSKGVPLLAKCHPLHPVAALLLGAVFKRFGQNERSAFSFLSSGEPFALNDFSLRAREGDLYSAEHLYDYLVAVFGDALLAGRDGKRWAEAFNVEAQHPDLTSLEQRILRSIAMLGIVGRWNGIAPTPAILQYVLSPSASTSEFTRAIKSLQAKSAIVYRRFNDTYSLWEGSDIDVEARIADMRSQIAADASVVQLLATYFAPRPLLARRHSYETGTLRHFDVAFANAATFADSLARLDAVGDGEGADGHVIILIPDASKGRSASLNTIVQSVAERPDVLVCVPANASELESLARELSAIERVQAVTTDLQHDATARRELSTRCEDVHGRLQQMVAAMLSPSNASDHPTKWYRSGSEEPVRSTRAVNELLSRVCDELFADAPQINNEIINRRDLSSSAAAARGSLIEKMLTNAETEGLGIKGNPPERSVYLSVLQALGIHAERAGRWTFAADDKQVRADAKALFSAIRGFFESAKEAPVGIDTLFALLRRQPFGLRNGVIPIFVCAALIGNESQVAIYEGNAFVPQLTDAIFDQIVKAPGRYKVRRWHVSGVRLAVFEQLGKMLGRNPVASRVEVKDLLDVVKPLMRFVRKLNDFSKQTKAFASITLAVRSVITDASEPDMLLFRDLPAACGVASFAGKSSDRSADVEKFLRALQAALSEMQRGYDLLLQNLGAELASALAADATERDRRKLLSARATMVRGVALNPDVKVFTARLTDGVPEDSIWIEQIAAFLANKHPSIWHDDDRARFSVRLAQIADSFKSLESLMHSRQGFPGIDDEHESLRIAVVGNRSAQTEQVVHLNRRELNQVSELELKIQVLFKPFAANGSRKLALAALAKVAQSLVTSATDEAHHMTEGGAK